MPYAIRVHQHGGPSALRWEPVEVAAPAGAQVRLRQTAVGLNFIDTYHRSGLYPVPGQPFVPGLEGAGVVEAIGPAVKSLKPGDSVMYCKGPIGAYATHRLIEEDDLLRLPQGVAPEQAAACLLRGCTAFMLLQRTFVVQAGMSVLVHAAAGGVGALVAQWAAHLGARVIGTVGHASKASLAASNGCETVLVLPEEPDWPARVRTLTDGQGCNVVYDGVGKDTFTGSLDSLRRFGLMVSFGQSSGPVPALDPLALMQRGSLFLTRPSLRDYIAETIEYGTAAAAFFDLLLRGVLKVPIGQSYYLSDAATAHADLEGRRTTGASVLIVDPQ
jgi:NADPH2:quinone reductase